jgi:NAD(P)H-dependent FMN reductase
VLDFREQLRQADAVIICTPEYAFGVPGSLKNALDWTVGSGEFINKPVALITASSQGEKGHAALLLILTAISARVIEKSSFVISFIRAKLNEKGEFKDPQTRTSLQFAIDTLIQEVSQELIK